MGSVSQGVVLQHNNWLKTKFAGARLPVLVTARIQPVEVRLEYAPEPAAMILKPPVGGQWVIFTIAMWASIPPSWNLITGRLWVAGCLIAQHYSTRVTGSAPHADPISAMVDRV
jgi:hypothetical protein